MNKEKEAVLLLHAMVAPMKSTRGKLVKVLATGKIDPPFLRGATVQVGEDLIGLVDVEARVRSSERTGNGILCCYLLDGPEPDGVTVQLWT